VPLKPNELTPATRRSSALACQGDASCSAWSYVKPGFQGPTARCYLKTPAPVAVNNPCCITGAKAVPPQPPGGLLELNSNRPGSDYANFPSGNGLLCLAACAGQANCKAWTFVKATSLCFLKSTQPPAVSDPCCTSGVK